MRWPDRQTAQTSPSRPEPAPHPRSITLGLGDKVALKFTLIPAGKFLMGSEFSAEEVAGMFGRCGGLEAYYNGEHPQREVENQQTVLHGHPGGDAASVAAVAADESPPARPLGE